MRRHLSFVLAAALIVGGLSLAPVYASSPILVTLPPDNPPNPNDPASGADLMDGLSDSILLEIHSTRVWHVYWQGTDCMTVFSRPGELRPADPELAAPPFGEESPHFTILSRCSEREQAWADLIAEARDVHELIERLGALQGVRLDEASFALPPPR